MAFSDPFAAKRALFTLLAANSGPAQALDGIQVAYDFPGNVGMRCIYGGGIRFDHDDDVAEAPGMLVRETVLVSAYIRIVASPAGEVADTDTTAAQVGAAILALVKANPKHAGPLTWVGVRSGQGDYQQTDDETISILGIQFRYISRITY